MADRTRTAGWLPKQHGAWAMLVVPFAAGAILSWQGDRLPAWVVPLFATWMLGYFAFSATSGLLKSAPQRRRRWLPATATYAGATLAAGLLTLWETGPAALWWLLAFAVPGGLALWLASRRQERRLIGGLLTVLVASMMVLVVRFPDPTTMLASPALPHAALVWAAMFGYFGGTVVHVKALIRERGQLGWRNASIGWHTAWTLAAAITAMFAVSSPWWSVFFLLTTLRSWLLLKLADRRRIRPAILGAVEIFLSLAILVVAAVTSAQSGHSWQE